MQTSGHQNATKGQNIKKIGTLAFLGAAICGLMAPNKGLACGLENPATANLYQQLSQSDLRSVNSLLEGSGVYLSLLDGDGTNLNRAIKQQDRDIVASFQFLHGFGNRNFPELCGMPYMLVPDQNLDSPIVLAAKTGNQAIIDHVAR